MNKIQDSIILSPKQSNAYKEIIRLLKKHDIKLYTVFAPIPKSQYRKFNYDSIKNLFRNTSVFFDYSQIESLDDSLHFYDSNHLNQLGVEVFNKKFIKESLKK